LSSTRYRHIGAVTRRTPLNIKALRQQCHTLAVDDRKFHPAVEGVGSVVAAVTD
jgi:hypothetical protein